MKCVLDASVLLALLREEPGAERVEMLLASESCLVSSVNLAEVISKVREAGSEVELVTDLVREVGMEIVLFDEPAATQVGRLRPLTRHLCLSLGDRACLATALLADAIAVTADRCWTDGDFGVVVECIRE